MSTAIPPRPRQVGAKRKFTFTIVASQFNQRYVQGLIQHATQELRMLAPSATVDVHEVPGAFEIPIVVQELAAQRRTDAILALGVILLGKTDHAQNLSRSVTDALQQISLAHAVPVIHGVLCVENETQAQERCLQQEMNRGTEAARAAVQIANVLSDLRERA